MVVSNDNIEMVVIIFILSQRKPPPFWDLAWTSVALKHSKGLSFSIGWETNIKPGSLTFDCNFGRQNFQNVFPVARRYCNLPQYDEI